MLPGTGPRRPDPPRPPRWRCCSCACRGWRRPAGLLLRPFSFVRRHPARRATMRPLERSSYLVILQAACRRLPRSRNYVTPGERQDERPRPGSLSPPRARLRRRSPRKPRRRTAALGCQRPAHPPSPDLTATQAGRSPISRQETSWNVANYGLSQPVTSAKPILRTGLSTRTATAPVWQASKDCSKCSLSRSVEQPWLPHPRAWLTVGRK